MLRNYIVIATRNLMNTRLYSLINIAGLSIGIACCLILALPVIDRLNFDRYHENADDIYRVVNKKLIGNDLKKVAMTQGVLAPELQKHFAEIKAATRVAFLRKNVSWKEKDVFEEQLLAVDSSFFKIFSISLKTRPISSSVISPEGILISESAARKIFGKVNPVGETVLVKDFAAFTVIGVFHDFPSQSHLQGDFIISFSHIERTQPLSLRWDSNLYYNYLLLQKDRNISSFNKKLNAFVHHHTPEEWKSIEYYVQPLLSIILDDTYFGNPFASIGRTYLVAFTSVGLIILLLACFNYMNMATARSTRRALEVGVRKVMGAYRLQLVSQFLMESLILCSISFLLAILWADLSLPFFNAYMGGQFSLHDFLVDYRVIAGLIGINFLLALVAGSYPAFFLSRFVPALVLKGKQISDASRTLRKGLVMVQFMLTGILVVMVLVVFRQAEFLRTRDLGFNKEGLVLFTAARNTDISPESFKAELLKIPGVARITACSSLPGRVVEITALRIANAPHDVNVKMGRITVDHDYIPALQLKLVAGRNFNPNGTDAKRSVILNELAVAALGWTAEEAIGKRVSGFLFTDSLPGEVVGVIKDFHLSSLRKEIVPLVVVYESSNNRYMARIDGNDFYQVRDRLEKALTTLLPEAPLNVVLMDDYLTDMIYRPEMMIGQILSFFTILVIIIGCMGLYALSAYEADQRVKELGIRKIMGATSDQLVVLVSRSFLKPVLLAVILCMPLAYFLGNAWLQFFPYRVSWSAGIFMYTIIFMIILGWLTVLSQAFRVSKLNPAETLRYE
ncbi:MAG: ABC transporter permease [Bacteroidota bacterium]